MPGIISRLSAVYDSQNAEALSKALGNVAKYFGPTFAETLLKALEKQDISKTEKELKDKKIDKTRNNLTENERVRNSMLDELLNQAQFAAQFNSLTEQCPECKQDKVDVYYRPSVGKICCSECEQKLPSAIKPKANILNIVTKTYYPRDNGIDIEV